MALDPRKDVLAQIPKGCVAVEVGVHEGDYSARILAQIEPKCLHLVDPWMLNEQPEYDKAWYGSRTSQDEMDARYNRVLTRYAAQISAGSVCVHRNDSAGAVAGVDGLVDFVYVDGDHTYEAVADDLRLWWPKVRPGGLVVGDDYNLGGWWGDGVIRAFNQWIARDDVEVHWKMGHQIILRKRSDI